MTCGPCTRPMSWSTPPSPGCQAPAVTSACWIRYRGGQNALSTVGTSGDHSSNHGNSGSSGHNRLAQQLQRWNAWSTAGVAALTVLHKAQVQHVPHLADLRATWRRSERCTKTVLSNDSFLEVPRFYSTTQQRAFAATTVRLWNAFITAVDLRQLSTPAAGKGCRPQMATAAATLTLTFIAYSVQCIVCSMCKYVDSSFKIVCHTIV